jgi:hypothetical protein
LHSTGLKFNSIEIGRLELEVVPSGSPCPSPTYYFKDATISPPSTAGSGTLPFDGTKRFVDANPKYLKTTGLLLSGDFDRKDGWDNARGNVALDKQTDPRTAVDKGYQYGVDFINPDVGNKITLKTEVENHHVRHAASFKYVPFSSHVLVMLCWNILNCLLNLIGLRQRWAWRFRAP